MNHQSYLVVLLGIYSSVPEEKRESFSARFTSQAQNPAVVFGFSAFLGILGVDRFVLGQVLWGLLKLFTLGGLYIWYIIDLFLVAGLARKKNIELARRIAASI